MPLGVGVIERLGWEERQAPAVGQSAVRAGRGGALMQ